MHGVPLIFVVAATIFAIILLIILERRHKKTAKEQPKSTGDENSTVKQNGSTPEHNVQSESAKGSNSKTADNKGHNINSVNDMGNEEESRENRMDQGHINKGLITDNVGTEELIKTKF